MTTPAFDLTTFDREKYDTILARGLCQGVGSRRGKMCIEAAICTALGLPHGDDPQCVSGAVRAYKIALNDANWSSPTARAKGLYALGLAQLGSKGVVSDQEFTRRLGKKTIQVLIPRLFRDRYPGRWTDLVDACEKTGERADARKLADAANAAYAAYASAAADAANAASAANAAYAAYASAADADLYLCLSASLALDVLRELGSPGVALLDSTP